MNAKEAVKSAKKYVSEMLAEEGIVNLGLEEIERDDAKKMWNITLGFSRPWNTTGPLSAIAGGAAAQRTYRTIRIRETDGHVVSMTRREPLD
ncbi:hypothetical protein EJC49_16650 [Aquibium carbonis]|uniref:Uncharacterized protein n=1 Tax=Aquibium carbonis TaxID=2495581 RepID=A0A3S0A5K6_9HYPH|nr:hypothetical protein [Aquibium carbonis]RST85262.1 hypothetical protein EJC49_16650 [Aquibium carbonis]